MVRVAALYRPPMTDTTTIEITERQKSELDSLKNADREAYKAVVDKLIAHYKKTIDDAELDETKVRELANEQIAERVVPEAQR